MDWFSFCAGNEIGGAGVAGMTTPTALGPMGASAPVGESVPMDESGEE